MTKVKRTFTQLPIGTKIVIGTAAVVFVVLATLNLFPHRTSVVDPHVIVEEGPSKPDQKKTRPYALISRITEGETARYAARQAETEGMAIASGLVVTNFVVQNHVSPTIQQIDQSLLQQGLLPPGLAGTQTPGNFVSPYSRISINFKAPTSIEIISIGLDKVDGAGLILRIPDGIDSAGNIRMFKSIHLTGITIPTPFAEATDVIAAGWLLEPVHQPQVLTREQIDQIREWSRQIKGQ